MDMTHDPILVHVAQWLDAYAARSCARAAHVARLRAGTPVPPAPAPLEASVPTLAPAPRPSAPALRYRFDGVITWRTPTRDELARARRRARRTGAPVAIRGTAMVVRP